MDFSSRLELSYYKTISTLNEQHHIELVQHQNTGKIAVKKILNVYNLSVFQYLLEHPIPCTPKILALYEEDHQLIIIEEYISGTPFDEIIQTRSLSEKEIAIYMLDLCKILNHLHQCTPPIIHRDLKPSNIILSSCNHLVLIDFNAAKPFIPNQTKDTVLLGTQGYAAPEQYGFGASMPQTDIYAFGILLKELSFINQSHLFDSIIKKCTQINPDDRYSSFTEIIKILESIADKKAPKLHKKYPLLPPGFRTLTPWKMLVGILGYIFIFWICLTVEIENLHGRQLLYEQIFILFIALIEVLIFSNYCNIQRIIPLCNHKNKMIHYFGVLLLAVLFFIILMMIMLIIEVLIFKFSL